MIEAGIKDVYLLENADKIFTREKRNKLMDKMIKEEKQGKKHTRKDIIWKI
jgi:hypothetical protein